MGESEIESASSNIMNLFVLLLLGCCVSITRIDAMPILYSGFVEPDDENELPSPKKIIENEMLNFFRQAQAELEEMLGKVPNNISSIPRIPSYGTADLNIFVWLKNKRP